MSLGVTYQAVDIDFLEGNLTGEFQAHHDHAGHPEEDDVKTGHQHIGGIKVFHVLCLFWPAQC